jgi:hypothetical protein
MIIIILSMTDLVQVNATMIVGILIFYTIPYIIKGGPYTRKESPYNTAVLYAIAFAIAFFAASAILAIMPIIVPLFVSEYLTIYGFIAITVAVIIFIKVIETGKYTIKKTLEERKARSILTVQPEFIPKSYEQTQEEEAKKSKAKNVLQKEDEVTEESEPGQQVQEKDEVSGEPQKKAEKVIEESEPVQQVQEKDEVSGEPQKKAEKVIEESKRFEVLPWGPPTREEDDDRSAR